MPDIKTLNGLLESIKVELGRPLSEAPESYADFLLNADMGFFVQVERKLKPALGGKLERSKVQLGRGLAWLEGNGQDAGDIDVEFTVRLASSPPNVTVYFDGRHAMRGSLDFNKSYKIGTLTPAEVVKLVVSQFFGMM